MSAGRREAKHVFLGGCALKKLLLNKARADLFLAFNVASDVSQQIPLQGQQSHRINFHRMFSVVAPKFCSKKMR